jgi:hypothetical protein
MSDDAKALVDTWRRIIVGEGKSWVLFKHGTCVILMATPPGELQEQAMALLKEWGPVVPGTPAGDFDVIELQDDPGWVVTCHHPDILTYVGVDEFEEGETPDDVVIGLIGRSKRDQDAAELEVVHIEG